MLYSDGSMSWLLFTAISVLGLSISILLQRVLMHTHKADPVAYTVLFQGLVGVLLAALVLITGFRLPNLDGLWLPALGCIVLYGLGHIVYAKTLQKVEASVFSILYATHAVWLMVIGLLFFNESLTVWQIIGAVLIFSSVALLVNLRRLSLDRGTLLGLATGVIFGLAIAMWSYVGRYTDALSWSAVSFIGSALVALAVYPTSVRKMKLLVSKAVLPKMAFLAVFYAIGSVAMLYAYKEGTFSVVSPLRQVGIIVTVLLALLFLPAERNRIPRKLVAAGICFIGVIAVIV